VCIFFAVTWHPFIHHYHQLHCLDPIGPFQFLNLVQPSLHWSSKTSVSLWMAYAAVGTSIILYNFSCDSNLVFPFLALLIVPYV
jgi:hypothetical protein